MFPCAQIISIRKRYIPLYKQCVAAGQLGGNDALWELDAQLPEKTIVLFRTMALAVRLHARAHKQVAAALLTMLIVSW